MVQIKVFFSTLTPPSKIRPKSTFFFALDLALQIALENAIERNCLDGIIEKNRVILGETNQKKFVWVQKSVGAGLRVYVLSKVALSKSQKLVV